MAQALIWSKHALDDIAAIAEYIGRDSFDHACQVVERLVETVQSIRDQPEAGRKVPELNDHSIRERFVYSYRLIYAVRPEEIEILYVVHGRRRFRFLGSDLHKPLTQKQNHRLHPRNSTLIPPFHPRKCKLCGQP